MLKLKMKIVNYLLRDSEVRKNILRELIKEAEVLQLDISNSEDVKISNCYIINSRIFENKDLKIENTVMDYCSITNNIMK